MIPRLDAERDADEIAQLGRHRAAVAYHRLITPIAGPLRVGMQAADLEDRAAAVGISEDGEVRSLAAHGIVALGFQYERDLQHPDRIAVAPRSVTFQDGTTRPSYDLLLHPRPESLQCCRVRMNAKRRPQHIHQP